MAILAVGFGIFQLFGIFRSDGVDTLVVNADDFIMGKFFLRKRRFDMALIAAIDALSDRIVGDSGNVSVTVPAFDTPVNAVIIKDLINIIIPALAIFTDSAQQAVFVAYEAIKFIGGLGPGAGQ
jgi:hypothetical protein